MVGKHFRNVSVALVVPLVHQVRGHHVLESLMLNHTDLDVHVEVQVASCSEIGSFILYLQCIDTIFTRAVSIQSEYRMLIQVGSFALTLCQKLRIGEEMCIMSLMNFKVGQRYLEERRKEKKRKDREQEEVHPGRMDACC